MLNEAGRLAALNKFESAHIAELEVAAIRVYLATQARNRAIVAAYERGLSLRAIGRASGLCHQRIHQIIRGL